MGYTCPLRWSRAYDCLNDVLADETLQGPLRTTVTEGRQDGHAIDIF